MRVIKILTSAIALTLVAPLASATDTDGDGIDDWWEIKYSMDPNDPSDATFDRDKDGLDALGEFINGTRPWQKDTDGDFYYDGPEVTILGTDPLDADSDDDLIFDGLEKMFGFDPMDPLSGPGDQDGDGFDTINELRAYSNPRWAGQVPSYDSDFTESFEKINLGIRWYNPTGSNPDWFRLCGPEPGTFPSRRTP